MTKQQTWRDVLLELHLIDKNDNIMEGVQGDIVVEALYHLDELADNITIIATLKTISKQVAAHKDTENKENSLKVRDLKKGNWAAIQNLFLYNPKYKEQHIQSPYPDGRSRSVSFLTRLAVYVCICSYAHGTKVSSFPGRETIASDTGLNIRVVTSALRDLEILGAIKTLPRYNNGGRTSNRYIILDLSWFE